ncbi:hypothetical protein DFH28DRAFT_945195 [Melampsora americana]|nr:hypothetical protein DFH28DRAFT_945195 [Melampsora americana]
MSEEDEVPAIPTSTDANALGSESKGQKIQPSSGNPRLKSRASHPIPKIRKNPPPIGSSSKPKKRKIKSDENLNHHHHHIGLENLFGSDSSDEENKLAQSLLQSDQKPILKDHHQSQSQNNQNNPQDQSKKENQISETDSDIEIIQGNSFKETHSNPTLSNESIKSSKPKKMSLDPSKLTTHQTDQLNSIKEVLTQTFSLLITEGPPIQSQQQALQKMYDSAAQLAKEEPGEAIYEAELIEKEARLKESKVQYQSLISRLVEPLSESMIRLYSENHVENQSDLNLKSHLDQLDQKIHQETSQLDTQQKQIDSQEKMIKTLKKKTQTEICKFESDFHLMIKSQEERLKELIQKIEIIDQHQKEEVKESFNRFDSNSQTFKDFESKIIKSNEENEQIVKDLELQVNRLTDDHRKSLETLENRFSIRIEKGEKELKKVEEKLELRNPPSEAHSEALKELEAKLEVESKASKAHSKSLKELEAKLEISIKASEAQLADIENKLMNQAQVEHQHQDGQYAQLKKTTLTERVEALKDLDNRLSTKIKADETKYAQLNTSQASNQASQQLVTQLAQSVQDSSRSLKELKMEFSKKDQTDKQTQLDLVKKACQECHAPCIDRVAKLEASFGKIVEEHRLQQSSKPDNRVSEVKARKDTSHPAEDSSIQPLNEEPRRQDLGVNSSRVPPIPTSRMSIIGHTPDPDNSPNPSNASNPTSSDPNPRPLSLTPRHPSQAPNLNPHKTPLTTSNLRLDPTLKAGPNHLRPTHMASPTPVESSTANTGLSLQQLEGLYSYLSHRLMNSNWLSEMIKTKVQENHLKPEVYVKKDDGELIQTRIRLIELNQKWKMLEEKVSAVDQRSTEIVARESKTTLGTANLVEAIVTESTSSNLSKTDIVNSFGSKSSDIQ